jgi:hypothetical protein
MVGPTITVMISASTRPGRAMNRSITGTIAVSTAPRKYPAVSPIGTPIRAATVAAPKPIVSDGCAP